MTSSAQQTIDSANARRRVFEAETALHAARQTHEDSWIRAAADRLHEALVALNTAEPRHA